MTVWPVINATPAKTELEDPFTCPTKPGNGTMGKSLVVERKRSRAGELIWQAWSFIRHQWPEAAACNNNKEVDAVLQAGVADTVPAPMARKKVRLYPDGKRFAEDAKRRWRLARQDYSGEERVIGYAPVRQELQRRGDMKIRRSVFDRSRTVVHEAHRARSWRCLVYGRLGVPSCR